MTIGSRVMLICLLPKGYEGPDCIAHPKIGCHGTVVETEDEQGDLEVKFDDFPLYHFEGSMNANSWTVHRSHIIYLKDEKA